MRIAITGGAGFIGSNLALELQKGNDVTVIDNLSSGNEKNLIGFEGKLVNSDVLNFIPQERFDAILHLAAITDTTFKPDSGMIRQNVEGFKKMLQAALKNNSDFIYASSAAVYGNSKVPMQENQGVHPLNAYAKSKVMIDDIAKEHFDKIKIIGLRYFNVFGPGEQFKGKSASMIFHLRNQILDGSPRLFRFGEQKRDHIYIKDVMGATTKAVKAKKSGIYNVGTGTATTFNELIKILNRVLGTDKKAEYFENPIKTVYQVNTQADTALAERGLGFKAEFSVKRGVEDYMKFLKEEGK